MKKIVALGLVVSMTLGVVACGSSEKDPLTKVSKNELIEAYRELEEINANLTNNIEQRDQVIKAMQEVDAPTAAISSTGDGSGGMTFNSYDAKIIFPTSFQYPGSQQMSANGAIDIVNNVSITPGSNWTCKMNGSTLELEHSSKISGTIKVGRITQLYDKSLLQADVLAPWLQELPRDQVVYNNIFLGNDMWGVQATTPTTIDSEDAFLRCGMLGYGEYSVVYVFVYRGLQDVNKDESITSILNTMTISGNPMIVEG